MSGNSWEQSPAEDPANAASGDAEAPASGKTGGFGIAGRLGTAFAATTLLTVLTAGVAWFAFSSVDRTLVTVTDEAMPAVANSLMLAADSSAVAAAAPSLVSARSEEARDSIRSTLAARQDDLSKHLEALRQAGIDVTDLADLAGTLATSMGDLDSAIQRREAARASLAEAVATVAQTNATFQNDIQPMIASANERMTAIGDEAIAATTKTVGELLSKHLAELKDVLIYSGKGQKMMAILARVSGTEDLDKLKAEEAAFSDLATELRFAINSTPDSAAGKAFREATLQLIERGTGENSAFEIRRGEINWVDLTPEQYEAVQAGRKELDQALPIIADAFEKSVTPLVSAAQRNMAFAGRDLSIGVRETIGGLVSSDVQQFRLMLESAAISNLLIGNLNAAASADSPSRLEEIKVEFEMSLAVLEAILMEVTGFERLASLATSLDQVLAFGRTEDGVFQRRAAMLAADADADRALTQAREVATAFGTAIASQVEATTAAARTIAADAETSLAESRMLVAVLAVAAVVVALAIGFLVVWRGVVLRLIGLAGIMRRLADGELDLEVDTRGRDEISAMAETVQVFRDSAKEVERLRADQLEAERRASEERQRQRVELADAFESRVKGIVDRLGSASRGMAETAKKMAAGAGDVRERSTAGVGAAQQTSSSVQTVAAAAEELSASIVEISNKVSESSVRAREAADQAEATNRTVETLEQATNRIGTVVTLIQDIAEQTNLLALNATIEAARAGEAGKGFAVVASEVKSLASQTGKATEEITQQIKSVQDGVAAAVTAIREVSEAIREIDGHVTAIAGAVEEQGASTQEIARSSQEAASGTDDVTRTIEMVSTVANDTGKQADEVLTSATSLAEDSSSLDREVIGFLDQVRGGGQS